MRECQVHSSRLEQDLGAPWRGSPKSNSSTSKWRGKRSPGLPLIN